MINDGNVCTDAFVEYALRDIVELIVFYELYLVEHSIWAAWLRRHSTG